MNGIIILSILFWIAVICIAIVAVLGLILAMMKITTATIKKIAVNKNKTTIISLIISAIFIIVISFSVLNYFVLKGPTDKCPENISLKEPLQKEEPIKQVQSQAPLPIKEPVLKEAPIEQVKPQAAALPKKEVPRTAGKKPKEKKQEKPIQPLKPSRTIFTVQVGAFSDLSHARFLRERLHKKIYAAYITSSTSIKEGKLYKVWIGKFSDREKAEILCKEIQKTEGLQAFVTLR
jgi:cell division septation protein DedD